jgi:hypothetical protein
MKWLEIRFCSFGALQWGSRVSDAPVKVVDNDFSATFRGALALIRY